MRRSSAGFGVAVLALSVLLAACNVQSPFSPDDKAIVSDIQAKLFQDSVLKTRDIRVSSSKGVVELSGNVQTDLEKAAAERVASQASGVKKVDNQIEVAPQASAKAEPAPEAPPARLQSRSEEPSAPRPNKWKAKHSSTRRVDRAAEPSNESTSSVEQSAPKETEKPLAAPEVASTPPPPSPPPPPPPPVQVTIPAGTVITIRMIDGVDSSRDQAGQEFGASVAAPIVVDDQVVVSQGADARVRLVKTANAGHMTGRSEVELALSSITVGGSNYDAVSTTYNQAGSSRGTRTAETVGGGAVLGGLLGAIAGHGKGAAIGSVVGAGAGTAAQAGTKAPPMKIAPETKIDFTLKSPIRVTLPPR
ncbi:MAG TPA: BON domain-containing protein [Terriglobia bacterium]|nr:BON domain-containing protein [Terriglobia bacterium]